MNAFVAHVFTEDAWRVRAIGWPGQFDRGVVSFRVQHDGGTGPSAFVDWSVREVPSGELEAVFVGSEHDVRAAIGRLDEWLLPHGWERWERSTQLLAALR